MRSTVIPQEGQITMSFTLRARTAFCASVFAATFSAVYSASSLAADAPAAVDFAARIAKGQQLSATCAACHGADGRASLPRCPTMI
jgi:cytochrome c553